MNFGHSTTLVISSFDPAGVAVVDNCIHTCVRELLLRIPFPISVCVATYKWLLHVTGCLARLLCVDVRRHRSVPTILYQAEIHTHLSLTFPFTEKRVLYDRLNI